MDILIESFQSTSFPSVEEKERARISLVQKLILLKSKVNPDKANLRRADDKISVAKM